MSFWGLSLAYRYVQVSIRSQQLPQFFPRHSHHSRHGDPSQHLARGCVDVWDSLRPVVSWIHEGFVESALQVGREGFHEEFFAPVQEHPCLVFYGSCSVCFCFSFMGCPSAIGMEKLTPVSCLVPVVISAVALEDGVCNPVLVAHQHECTSVEGRGR